MIVGLKQYLEQRCIERGYTLEEIMPCVVSQNGDMWTVDETHPAYPAKPKPSSPAGIAADAANGGPGTELKALLKLIGITASPTCSCNARAMTMDANEAREPGWCERNMETILDWLKEQADARGLPFLRAGAKVLVKRAISNARRKAAKKGNNT